MATKLPVDFYQLITVVGQLVHGDRDTGSVCYRKSFWITEGAEERGRRERCLAPFCCLGRKCIFVMNEESRPEVKEVREERALIDVPQRGRDLRQRRLLPLSEVPSR